MSLPKLVAALPEVYQPIYGHAEFDAHASRSCDERLGAVLAAYRSLAEHLGRPLRILDLGCAQGFFSFNLAAHGASVTGIDRVPENIALCRALAAEHPALNASFRCSSIEDTISNLVPGEFDLIIGLSVLHHICLEQGAQVVRTLVASLVNKTEAALFETALREEPVSWGASQPADYHWLFDDFPFLITLSTHATHLSTISRPLIYASGKHWLLGTDMRTFGRWSAQPHELAHPDDDTGRRYFFADDVLAKTYRFVGPQGSLNRQELENERRFLSQPLGLLPSLPQLIGWAADHDNGWLLRTTNPGKPLSTLIAEGNEYDPGIVVSDVLDQLAALEKAKFFHDDLRVWNVLIQPDGHALLIDYGSISKTNRDREWPYDLKMSFLLFVHEVFGKKLPRTRPTRSPRFSHSLLSGPHQGWLNHIWFSGQSGWSFSDFQESLRKSQSGTLEALAPPPIAYWVATIEDFLDRHTFQHEARIAELEAQISAMHRRWEQQDRTLHFLAPLIGLVRRFSRRT